MSTADCQKSGVEGKTLGLHSALFSERGDGNTRVNLENYGKNAKNRLQLVKLGWDTESPQYRQRPNRRVSDEEARGKAGQGRSWVQDDSTSALADYQETCCHESTLLVKINL